MFLLTGSMNQRIYWISFINPFKYLIKFWIESLFYMDNDAKHVSVEILKWFWRCKIKIEAGTLYLFGINPFGNVFIIFKKKLQEYCNQSRVLDLATKIQKAELKSPQFTVSSPTKLKKNLKSNSEIDYFFFKLFCFLKARLIIDRIIRKRNSLFLIRI